MYPMILTLLGLAAEAIHLVVVSAYNNSIPKDIAIFYDSKYREITSQTILRALEAAFTHLHLIPHTILPQTPLHKLTI
jgi:hypothetical protein